jgi:hypothetical protein
LPVRRPSLGQQSPLCPTMCPIVDDSHQRGATHFNADSRTSTDMNQGSKIFGLNIDALGGPELDQGMLGGDVVEVGRHRHPDFDLVGGRLEISRHPGTLVQFDDRKHVGFVGE